MKMSDKKNSSDLIDEMLSEADPAFVKDLNSINPNVLNGLDLGEVSDDADVPTGWKSLLWYGHNKRKKILMATGGFIVGIAIPLITLAFFGYLTPKYSEGEGYSMATSSDETLMITAGEEKGNLFKIFPILVYSIEIPEKVYTFKPGDKIRFGRFSFYIELFNREDILSYATHQEYLEEAFVNAIRKTRGEDWFGSKSKEHLRALLLAEINKAMTVKAKAIRFKSIFI
jgi:hypothetical protein